MPRLALILVALLGLGLAQCGRKGALEPPPDQHLVSKGGKAVDPGYVRPRQSFPLDPLLN
jgi:hypothetical protein